MGIGHAHHHGNTSRSLGVAFLLNISFTIVEIIGGLLTNSIAILSDAVHDAGDSLSLASAWFLQRVSNRQSDTTFTYGYRRFSVLGALITAVFLLIGLGFVLTQAIQRFSNPESVHAPGMIAIALLGILMNGIATLKLRGGTSLNEKVASWHLLEDVLGWVAVLVGAIILLIWEITETDPILSIGISLFVLWNVLKRLKTVFSVFLQHAPPGFQVAQFIKSVKKLPGVQDVHHTHTWTIDGEHHVLTTHLTMHRNTTRPVMVKAKESIRSMLPLREFEHVTIDIELENERCVSKPLPSPLGS